MRFFGQEYGQRKNGPVQRAAHGSVAARADDVVRLKAMLLEGCGRSRHFDRIQWKSMGRYSILLHAHKPCAINDIVVIHLSDSPLAM